MQIAIFGATGCMGNNLIKKLLSATDHQIIAACQPCSREETKNIQHKRLTWRQLDMSGQKSTAAFVSGSQIAVYLIHSLAKPGFENLDKKLALAAAVACRQAGVEKIIYLGGIIPKGQAASAHLQSRTETGLALAMNGLPVAEVRASIILGECSVSYKMVWSLARRYPIIFAPRAINSLCSPIALDDAIDFLAALIGREIKGHEIFEIGAEILSYKELISRCGQAISGRRKIIVPVPFLPIRAFSWIFGLSSKIDGRLAMTLAESLKNNSNFTNNRFKEVLGREPRPIDDALKSLVA